MAWLLDTDAVIALLNDRGSRTARRARAQRPAEVAVSSIVMHELYDGAFRSARVERNLALVDALRFEVLEFDRDDAREAGAVRAALAAHGGAPVDPYDVLIAGQARARGLVLVTRNTGEFARVPDLRIEDWEAR
jgi:tRNA(fMet)-specific endonuclease VapC